MTRSDRSAPRVILERHARPEDVAVVVAGLSAFNVAHSGDAGWEAVTVFLRDAVDDRVVGGLLGEIRWRWLYVSKLWVSEAHRGGGAGTRLMAAAESRARERDCIGVYLDTFEYQARPFYERLGFEVYGTLEGFPPGFRQYYLAKRLAPLAPPDAAATTATASSRA
jgi:GNAT superfamily N-acetyltransferase